MEVLSIQRFDQMCRQRNEIYVFAEEIKCLQNKDTIIQIDLGSQINPCQVGSS